MIKKLIVMGLLCFVSASFHAQKTFNINLSSKKDTEVSPIVKEKVEEYAAKINAIIQEEKSSWKKSLRCCRPGIWTRLNSTEKRP
ncbi:hypothetical protein OWR28_24465 [Chryseobacterium sp. 1B4]